MSRALDGEEIHITHKHPSLGYKNRTDLDPQECVVAYYPLALANKIIPFLDKDRLQEHIRAARRDSILSDSSNTVDEDTVTVKVANRVRSSSRPRSVSRKIKEEAEATPLRSVPRTKDRAGSISRSQSMLEIPSARKTPLAKAVSELTDVPMTTPRRQRKSRQPLVQFDTTPQIVDRNYARPVLVLRHDLSTQALRDVFNWAKQCATAGRIVKLEGNMILFRDTARVEELWQVCVVFGLKIFERECRGLLQAWTRFEASPRRVPESQKTVCNDDPSDVDCSWGSGSTLAHSPRVDDLTYSDSEDMDAETLLAVFATDFVRRVKT